MNIDYGKIVTNALSTLVAAVFVGAAAIVWNAATSVDDRIEEATSSITANQDIILPEVAGIKVSIEDLQAQIQSLTKHLAEAKAIPSETLSKTGTPVVSNETAVNLVPDWTRVEADRLKQKIDVRQQQIYEQTKMR